MTAVTSLASALVLVSPACFLIGSRQQLSFACRPLAWASTLRSSLDAIEDSLSHTRLGVVTSFVYTALAFLTLELRHDSPV